MQACKPSLATSSAPVLQDMNSVAARSLASVFLPSLHRTVAGSGANAGAQQQQQQRGSPSKHASPAGSATKRSTTPNGPAGTPEG